MLIHATFDEVDTFVPRVPEFRLPREDGTTPRICVTDSLKHSVAAMPGIMKTTMNLCELGYEPVIHCYELIPEHRSDVVRNVNNKVPDGSFNHEKWLMQAPKKVLRKDYRWIHPDAVLGGDENGIANIRIRGSFIPIQPTDGVMDFIRFTGAPEENVMRAYAVLREMTLKKMFYSLDKMMDKLKEDRHRNKEIRYAGEPER